MFLSKLFKKNNEAKKHMQNNKGDENVSKMLWVVAVFVVGSLLLTIVSGAFSTKTADWYDDTIGSWFNDANGMYGEGSAGENSGGNGGTNDELDDPEFGDPDIGDPDDEPQDSDTYAYYSTLRGAITDVNGGITGQNADASIETAAVATFIDENNVPNILVLRDLEETSGFALSKKSIVNLGGNTINFTGNTLAFDIKQSANVAINGETSGSGITISNPSGAAALFQCSMSQLTINGGTYSANANGAVAGINANNGSTIHLNNAKLTAVSDTSDARCISANYISSNIYTNNSNMSVMINDPTKKAYGIYNAGFINCVSTTILADMSYSDDISTAPAMGIFNKKTCVLENCNVYGVGYGIENIGEGAQIYVNGGDYASGVHGGFYFSHGATGKAYVRNASIGNKYVGAVSEWIAYFNDTSNMFGKVYIGGSSNSYASNMKVHLDNITWYGPARSIILRDTSAEQNNSVYISTPVGTSLSIRIDNNTHSAYLGSGYDENITINATDSTRVFYTNERYIIADNEIPTSATAGSNTDTGWGDIID